MIQFRLFSLLFALSCLISSYMLFLSFCWRNGMLKMKITFDTWWRWKRKKKKQQSNSQNDSESNWKGWRNVSFDCNVLPVVILCCLNIVHLNMNPLFEYDDQEQRRMSTKCDTFFFLTFSAYYSLCTVCFMIFQRNWIF